MMTVIHIAGHTITIEQDLINVTPSREPDPSWSYRDKHGHVHFWVGGAVGSVREVIDVEETDEYPARLHYECSQCGERVEPGYRTPPFPQYVNGLEHITIDGKPATRAEVNILIGTQGTQA